MYQTLLGMHLLEQTMLLMRGALDHFFYTNQLPTSMALKQHSSLMTFQLGCTWNSTCKWPLANYADDNVRTLRSADDRQCTREFHQTLEGGCMKQGQYEWNF